MNCTTPRLDWRFQECAKQRLGLAGRYTGIGFGSGYGQIGVNQQYVVAGQVQPDLFKYIALFDAILWPVLNKKRTVAAQFSGVGFALSYGQGKAKLGIEQVNCCGRIGRATAQPRANGHYFVQVNLNRRQVVVGAEQVVGAYAEVGCGYRNGRPVARSVGLAGNGQAAGAETKRGGRNNLQRVGPANGVEYRQQVMKPVGPTVGQLQTNIDFAGGKSNHEGEDKPETAAATALYTVMCPHIFDTMSDFFIYLRLGFDHITDPNGYDHILFVVALCAVYTMGQWRQVLVLVTAFTIGHSITLALATLNLIQYRTDLIELLIPITILSTAIANFFYQEPRSRSSSTTNRQQKQPWRYALALAFGLIHGLGFSNYLRSLLGRDADIATPLLAFNIGLELGQLLIVGIMLVTTYLVLAIRKNGRLRWTLIISGMVAGMAISLIMANPLVAK